MTELEKLLESLIDVNRQNMENINKTMEQLHTTVKIVAELAVLVKALQEKVYGEVKVH